MSVLGTGVAAGVAQTALTAQQAARQRDKRTRDTRDEHHRVREVFEQHIRGLQENDGDDGSAARLAVDTQTASDHEDPVEDALSAPTGRDNLDPLDDLTRQTPAPVAPPPAPAAYATPPRPEDNQRPLYRHVDVKA